MSVGKLLIVMGVIVVAVGLLWVLGEGLGLKLGRLPGDIVVRGQRSTFYFPVVTCLVLSVLLSLLLGLAQRWAR